MSNIAENASVHAVSQEGITIEHGVHADEIVNITPLSSINVVSSANNTTLSQSSASVSARASKKRYKLFLRILQKINMVFLVTFVCYFAWTISANFGHNSSGIQQTTGNESGRNATIQLEDSSNSSGNRYIPNFSSDDNHTDPPYHTNIVLPAHRKQTKKRRKKERNRKRNRRLRNRHKTYSNLDDYLNLTIEPRKNKNRKRPCSNCKIKKRKGRNEFGVGRISPSTLRKILEKVADETLSGARSGEGTISSLLDETNADRSVSKKDKTLGEESGWSYNQHWVNIAAGETISSDDTAYESGGNFKDSDASPWSSWTHCSTTCGAGQQERTRKCGTACKEVESMVCVNPACSDTTSDESRSTITEFYKWENEGFVPPLRIPEQEFLDPNTDVCESWVTCNKQFAQDFLNNSSLPGCPCFFPLKRVNSLEIWDVQLNKSVIWEDASGHSDLVYKPEAHVCMRSQLAPGTVTLAVQQCCYDSTFALVTRGKAAGTPNLISPDISKELHYKVDLLPWIICKGDWTKYNQVLPPNNRLSCHERPDEQTIMRQTHEVKRY